MVLEAGTTSVAVAPADRMDWFEDAKLGIFIHYGIYAVNGISESWAFHNRDIEYEPYMRQMKGFTADKLDPKYYAELFKEAGARYAVLTTKHHDGVALWRGDWEHYNTVDHTPAARELVPDYVRAMREAGIKVGLYFSLVDWSHNDYPEFLSGVDRYKISDDPKRWDRYISFYFKQMEELSKRFNPALFWFDGDWEHTAEEWRSPELVKMLRANNPNVIVNSRLAGHGDYATPEQGVPIVPPKAKYWELCMTCNDSWGYQPYDTNYKTPFQIISIFVDCLSMGGNLLLDVGPDASGAIPAPQVDILRQLGGWSKKHSEAIYGTRAGLPAGHCHQRTAVNKAGDTLYIYLEFESFEPIVVAGVEGELGRVYVVGTNKPLQTSRDLQHNNDLWINPPRGTDVDSHVTVIAVKFLAPFTVRPEHTIDDNRFITRLIQQHTPWFAKHKWPLQSSGDGISEIHFRGISRLSPDRKYLYLLVPGKPKGPLVLKGIMSKIARAFIAGDATIVHLQTLMDIHWAKAPGLLYIDLAPHSLDETCTIVCLQFREPLRLYPEDAASTPRSLLQRHIGMILARLGRTDSALIKGGGPCVHHAAAGAKALQAPQAARGKCWFHAAYRVFIKLTIIAAALGFIYYCLLPIMATGTGASSDP